MEGVSLSDIDQLTIEDTRNLWDSLQAGIWGPQKDYILAYNQLSVSHLTTQIVSSALGGNIKPLAELDKLFPGFYRYASLNKDTNPELSISDKNELLAKQAALAMIAMGGVPKNIQNIVENTNDKIT